MLRAVEQVAEFYGIGPDNLLNIYKHLLADYPSNLIEDYDKKLANFLRPTPDHYTKIINRQPGESARFLINPRTLPSILTKLARARRYPDLEYVCQNFAGDLNHLRVMFYSYFWLGYSELQISIKNRNLLFREKLSVDLLILVSAEADFRPHEFIDLYFLYGREIFRLFDKVLPTWYDDYRVDMKIQSPRQREIELDIFRAFADPKLVSENIIESVVFTNLDYLLEFIGMIWETPAEFRRIRDEIAGHLQKNFVGPEHSKLICRKTFINVVDYYEAVFGKARKSQRKIDRLQKFCQFNYRANNFIHLFLLTSAFEVPEKQGLAYFNRTREFYTDDFIFPNPIKIQLAIIRSRKIARLVKHRLAKIYQNTFYREHIPEPEFLACWAEIVSAHGEKKIRELCQIYQIQNLFSVKFLNISGYSKFITSRLLSQPFIREPPESMLQNLKFDTLESYFTVKNLFD